MTATFEPAIAVVLQHEGILSKPGGSWCDVEGDLGGETNFGISTKTIREEGISAESMGLDPATAFTPGWLKALTQAHAVQIYRTLYWDRYGYAQINDQTVATKIFDFAVNAGPGHAAQVAQRAALVCGQALTVDGTLGPKSFAAINAVAPTLMVAELAHQMIRYYEGIISARPANEKFRGNWLHRAAWGV